MVISPVFSIISVRLSSPNCFLISFSSSTTTSIRSFSLASNSSSLFISFNISLYSSTIFSLSRAVSLWSFISRIACAWISESLNLFIRPSLASWGPLLFLISVITSSRLSMAIFKPSNIWALSFAFLSSNIVRLVTTSFLNLMNCRRSSLRFRIFGWPSTMERFITPNVPCICVCRKRLFSITSETSSLLSSTTILIPSLSDSSLISDMPSIFLSLTSSAIFSMSFVLLT